MFAGMLEPRQAKPAAAIRHWQPALIALLPLMFIDSLDAPNECFNGLTWSSLRRKCDELEHFVVASFKGPQLLHSREQRVNAGVGQLLGIKAMLGVQRTKNCIG